MQKENFPIPEGKKEEAILQSIHLNKIIIPIIIGIFTVAYLVWKQVEWKDLKNISWNGFTLFWLSIALVFYLYTIFLILFVCIPSVTKNLILKNVLN